MRKPIVLAAAALAVVGHAAAQQHPFPPPPGTTHDEHRRWERSQREFHDQLHFNRPSMEVQNSMVRGRAGSHAPEAPEQAERRRRLEQDRRARGAGDDPPGGKRPGGGPWSASPWSATPWSDELWRRYGGATLPTGSGLETAPLPARRSGDATPGLGDPARRRGERR